MTNAALSGKPDAGNPHVRFDEGEVAPAKPRRGSLFYKAVPFLTCSLLAILSARAEPFQTVIKYEGPRTVPLSIRSLPAFSEFVPKYAIHPELHTNWLTRYARALDYPKNYVRNLSDRERRLAPYRLEDLWPHPRQTVDSDYARSGKPFFLYERHCRPAYFIAADGYPQADRADYVRWCREHPGCLGWCGLCELDSDSNYFEKNYQTIGDPAIAADLQARFGPPDAKGRAHRVRWARILKRLITDMHFGDARINPECSNDMGYEHIFGAFGANILFYEATSQTWGAWNLASAFLRGAARQYGRDCAWYMAHYYSGYDRKGTSLQGGSRLIGTKRSPALPYRGESRSLHRRQAAFGWLIGAKYLETEGWAHFYLEKAPDGTLVPSDHARDYNAIYELARRVDRGTPFTPLAILTPLAEPCRTNLQTPDFIEPETQKTIFGLLVPALGDSGTERVSRRKGEQGCLFNSEFPQFFDSLCPDAGQDHAAFAKALSRYRHVLIAGQAFDKSLYDSAAIEAFAKAGGKVHRYPSAECPTPEALRTLLRAIRDETMPVTVEGDVYWGVNETPSGRLVYLFNNKGVTKYCDEPETFDFSRTAHVTVTEKASGRKTTLDIPPGDFQLLSL